MGRSIEMGKIEDVTKCQVTFSKRRSSIIKKVNDIAITCDVDVAFIAFSNSGRVSKFCNNKRIEEVLHRYVDQPTENRLNDINDIEKKLEKLRHLGHIKSDTNKLLYLDRQIENLELQIKKSELGLQILEADLRDFEVDSEQEPSLHQLSWCERNLTRSLQRVTTRKNVLSTCPALPVPNLQNQEEEIQFEYDQNYEVVQNSRTGQILMKLDPWINPYSVNVRNNIIQDLIDQKNTNPGPSRLPIGSNACNFSYPPIILESGIMATSGPQQAPFSSATLSTFQAARNSSRSAGLNFRWMSNMDGGGKGHDHNMYHGNNSSNINVNEEEEEYLRRIGRNEMHTTHRSMAPSYKLEFDPDKKACKNSQQDQGFVENKVWNPKARKSNMWECNEFLVEDKFNEP